MSDFTPEAQERLLALIVIPDPWWYLPVVRVLAVLPRTDTLSDRLDNWHTARAVRLYRRNAEWRNHDG